VTEAVLSVGKVSIRLTAERWSHIVDEHCELAGMRFEVLETVASPKAVFAGGAGELLAIREVAPGKQLVVVYREMENDGFIITAFITSKTHTLYRRTRIWP